MKKRAYSAWMVVLALAIAISPLSDAVAKEATSPTKEKTSKAKETRKVRLAHIKLTGSLPESPGQMSFFGDLGIDLRKTIARLDKAAEDKTVEGVVLEIGPVALSNGKINEVREAITRYRSSGKKIYAQLESATGGQYLIAAACDEIVMPAASVIVIPGIHAEMSFYKEMLEKLGIEADMLHVGAFKGAAEPLTRTKLSEPVRKNLTAMIDDMYDQMVTMIASDRQMKVEEVRELIDEGLLTVAKAHKGGMVDRVLYPDEFRAQLKNEYEADKLVYVLNYAKKKLDTDFSGPMGMIKLFQTMMGVNSSKKSFKGPRIALVYAVGAINSGKSVDDVFGGQTMGSTTIVEALQKAASDDSVKAIVLRINSPGGSALASDLIWRATQATDKPIVASMGDVAASGGYYIAMGADHIVAEPGTITGSIGVVGGKLAMKGLYDKIGLTTDVISRGKNSSIFSATEKFTESEREVFTEMMQETYRIFTTKAAAGRKMELEKIEELAGGQVYTGRDAKRNGLVDELGTLKDAIQAAKRLAGLEPAAKVELKVLPKPKNPFESLFEADLDSEREASVLAGVKHLAPELAVPLRRAYQIRKVMKEPVALIMPFWIDIKQ